MCKYTKILHRPIIMNFLTQIEKHIWNLLVEKKILYSGIKVLTVLIKINVQIIKLITIKYVMVYFYTKAFA